MKNIFALGLGQSLGLALIVSSGVFAQTLGKLFVINELFRDIFPSTLLSKGKVIIVSQWPHNHINYRKFSNFKVSIYYIYTCLSSL